MKESLVLKQCSDRMSHEHLKLYLNLIDLLVLV